MFEREDATTYKCKRCKYFNLQWEEKTLNVNGDIKKVTVWFPLCMCAFHINSLYLAIERCKYFEKKV